MEIRGQEFIQPAVPLGEIDEACPPYNIAA